MENYWQEIIIGTLVLSSSAYLIATYMKKRLKGGCRSCPVARPGTMPDKRNPNTK